MHNDKCFCVSKVRFKELPDNGSGHIGFVGFVLGDKLAFKGIAVYKHGDGFRLVYPESNKGRTSIHPIEKETQKRIDQEITKFINQTKGAINEQNPTNEINYNR